MSYTRRTCVDCGYRDIQPNMIRVEREVKTGKSQGSTSIMTWIGALFGHRPSQRAIGRHIFNSAKRNYYRVRKVWLCPDCAK